MPRKRLAKKQHIDTDNRITKLPYDVLILIFKNLNGKDLCNAAMVCRSWLDVANNEKKLRGPCTVLEDWDIRNANNKISEQHIDCIQIKPVLSFIFTGTPEYDYKHEEESVHVCGAEEQETKRCRCKLLPQSCQHIVVENYGFVKDQTEFEANNIHKAVWMMLPYHKDIHVEIVCGNDKSVPGKRKCVTEQNYCRIEKVVGILTNSSHKPKCLIYLTSEEWTFGMSELKYFPRDRELVIWGGVARELRICNKNEHGKHCHQKLSWIAIVISGDHVKSWSVILKKTHNTKEKIEEQMMKLKSKVELKKYSMGLMFACCGRGYSLFQEENVESTIFNKVFPTVPLVGSFGDGEYGNCMVERVNRRHHQYSTVFMILTYG